MSLEEEVEDGNLQAPTPVPPPPPTICLKAEDETGLLCDEFAMYLDGYGDVSVIASGRELVCLQMKDITLYVCNPSTHELLKLPNPSQSFCKYIDCFALRFVPSLNYYRLLHVYYATYDEYDPEATVSEMLDIKNREKLGRWRFASERFPYIFHFDMMKLVQTVDVAAY
ncbi:hypothetical protein REPUB_Repub03eG0149900 [Reevesia pubescens]